jgi:hypothetical protein
MPGASSRRLTNDGRPGRIDSIGKGGDAGAVSLWARCLLII